MSGFITLGLGGSDSLTPFITSGLGIGSVESVVDVLGVGIIYSPVDALEVYSPIDTGSVVTPDDEGFVFIDQD